ncbi:uncharacterized protein LOC124533217 [Vanessa cardui]|uniref:uncharacterized protein LOC124533217 n=1 Tax=Vanessa cardui TaxID=171605 RepID=UPI001F128EF3|nr:uncharacterized protein LOC124533217 [Vanessa cardui]
MAMYSADENLSDDEVFFGKLSLKEVKKRILCNNFRQTFSCSTDNDKFVNDESISVIETHSEPDIYSGRNANVDLDCSSNANTFPRASTDWDVKSTDDSFLKLEEIVTEMYTSPKPNVNNVLDNTLEVVEYILNNAHLNDNENNKAKGSISETVKESQSNIPEIITSSSKGNNDVETKKENESEKNEKEPGNKTIESKTITDLQVERLYDTPLKSCNSQKHVQSVKTEGISTPFVETKCSKEIFKTPKNPLSSKKYPLSSTKKTPSKMNAFQHITSPVASYIKNGPQVPLLRDVHPKKPLPKNHKLKIKTTIDNKLSNKENVSLPSLAYRSAKKTKVITIPDKEKLPESPWAKRVASSLPKPVIIKHDHREMNAMKKSLLSHQEDSFADLTLHQADLSVCTQKSAVKKPL